MHCAQNQTKMAASKEDVQQISSACAIAKQALKAIGNLQNKDIRNLATLTATNSSSTNSILSSSSGSIAAELARRFPSYNARGATSRKRPSTSSSTNSMSRGKKNGRPNKTIIHKDLVIIPNPDTNQVPSHVSKVKLEERGLIIPHLPFNKDWTHLACVSQTSRKLFGSEYAPEKLPKTILGVSQNARVFLARKKHIVFPRYFTGDHMLPRKVQKISGKVS